MRCFSCLATLIWFYIAPENIEQAHEIRRGNNEPETYIRMRVGPRAPCMVSVIIINLRSTPLNQRFQNHTATHNAATSHCPSRANASIQFRNSCTITHRAIFLHPTTMKPAAAATASIRLFRRDLDNRCISLLTPPVTLMPHAPPTPPLLMRGCPTAPAPATFPMTAPAPQVWL